MSVMYSECVRVVNVQLICLYSTRKNKLNFSPEPCPDLNISVFFFLFSEYFPTPPASYVFVFFNGIPVTQAVSVSFNVFHQF